MTHACGDRKETSSITHAAGTVTCKHDALNQCVSKILPMGLASAGAACFIYDEHGQLIHECEANRMSVYAAAFPSTLVGGALARMGTAAANRLAVSGYDVHMDHLDALGAFGYDQGFQGQVFDSDTGLFQNWNREYDPRQYWPAAPTHNPANANAATQRRSPSWLSSRLRTKAVAGASSVTQSP